MIYLLGAGKSAIYLIEYLGNYLHQQNQQLVVLDRVIDETLIQDFPHVKFIADDLYSDISTAQFEACKVAISFLPAFMHPKVAEICLQKNKHLVTASYVTPELEALGAKAKAKGLSFLFEMGLDPGIDHMSAMQLTRKLKKEGHTITSFKSYCGALLAPESDTNPWHYKFTWNPMNVVLAGQNIAGYVNNGKHKYMLPNHLYAEHIKVKTPSGDFDGYYNRDSISYHKIYDLEEADAFVRGTLRGDGFCTAWQVLIDLGLTHHQTVINVTGKTVREVMESFIFERNLSSNFWESFQQQVGILDNTTLEMLKYLDLDSTEILPLTQATPAEYLLHILQQKWALSPTDKDRIVLWHEVKTKKDDKEHTFNAVLDLVGESEHRTAIAKTVSLPAAFAAQLLYENKLNLTGMHIPVIPELYEPILEMLAQHGIELKEF